MSFHDPLSPFSDPHRDTATWPATPHSPADLPPALKSASRASSVDGGAQPSPLGQPAAGFGPYGQEPKIYGQPEPGLISPQATTASNGTAFEKPEPYLRVRITALDRNRRDILVRFDAQTNLSNFTGTTYRNVSRSYVEFQRFYEQIVYSNPQTIIPALPLPQTSAPTDEEDDRIVRVMLQRWISRVCEDAILLADEELRSFVESDFGYQPMPRKPRRSGSSFNILGRRPPDEDEELQRARFELTRLETQFLEAARTIDKLSISRKSMAMAHAAMGNKLIEVATTEVHPPLAAATRKMGRTWHSYADLDQAQAISDCVILGDTLGYQGMNARSARETLLQRSSVLEEYQEAVKSTIAKRRNIERLKASSNIRPERVDDALEELEEADKVERYLHQRVEGISQNLHRALHRHSRLAHEDLMASLIEHARTNILYERQLLRELEGLVPDIKASADAALPQPQPVQNPIPPLTASVPNLGQYASANPPLTSGAFMPRPAFQAISASSPSILPQGSIPSAGLPPVMPPAVPVAAQTGAPYLSPNIVSQPQPQPQPSLGPPLGSSVPAFPRTNQFVSTSLAPSTPSGSITPGFPRTNQFVSSTPSPRLSSSFAAFPRTNQFVTNPSPAPQQQPPNGAPSPAPPSTVIQPQIPAAPHSVPVVAPTPQVRATTPGIPSPGLSPQVPQQMQNHLHYSQPHLHAGDPLGGGARVISSQQANVPAPLSASTPALMVDPLTGAYTVQGSGASMTPNAQHAAYGPLSGSTVGPVPSGTMRGAASLQQQALLGHGMTGTFRTPTQSPQPTRSRLDAREAASKLANLF